MLARLHLVGLLHAAMMLMPTCVHLYQYYSFIDLPSHLDQFLCLQKTPPNFVIIAVPQAWHPPQLSGTIHTPFKYPTVNKLNLTILLRNYLTCYLLTISKPTFMIALMTLYFTGLEIEGCIGSLRYTARAIMDTPPTNIHFPQNPMVVSEIQGQCRSLSTTSFRTWCHFL